MDKTGEYYATLNKPGGKRQIPYDLIYNRNLVNKTNEQNRTRGIETRNTLTGTRGKRRGESERKNRKGLIKEQA